MFKEIHLENILKFTLIIWCIFSALFYFSPIISLWESAEIYKNFTPIKKPLLIFGISEDPVLFSPNSFFSYPTIAISRYITDVIGLSIFNIRLPSIIYGITTLIFFYIVSSRAFGKKIAFLSTFFLATSNFFIIYQHIFLSPISTMMAILICLERYQNLTINKSKVSIFTFALACCFAAMQYWTARWSLLIILSFYLIDTKEIYLFKIKKLLQLFNKERIKNFIKLIILISLIFLILYPGNLILFYDTNFIVPQNRAGEYTKEISNLFQSLFLNTQFFFKYYIFNNNSEAYEILSHVPFNIEDKIILIFFIVGFFSTILTKPNNKKILIIVLFILNFIAPLLSETDPTKNIEIATTLSPHRLFFIIPFICLFAVIGIFFLHQRLNYLISSKLSQLVLIISIFFVITFRISFHHLEYEKYNTKINDFQIDLMKPQQEGELIDEKDFFYKYSKAKYNQIYFYKLAKHLSSKKYNDKKQDDNFNAIVIEENKLTPNNIVIGSLVPKLGDKYYFPLFLTLYLREENLPYAFLVEKKFIQESYSLKLFKILENYKSGNNEVGKFPRNKSQEVFLNILDKLINIYPLNKYFNKERLNKLKFSSKNNLDNYIFYPESLKKGSLLLVNAEELEEVKKLNKFVFSIFKQ